MIIYIICHKDWDEFLFESKRRKLGSHWACRSLGLHRVRRITRKSHHDFLLMFSSPCLPVFLPVSSNKTQATSHYQSWLTIVKVRTYALTLPRFPVKCLMSHLWSNRKLTSNKARMSSVEEVEKDWFFWVLMPIHGEYLWDILLRLNWCDVVSLSKTVTHRLTYWLTMAC